MANVTHKFKDTDVKRVIRAAREAGLTPHAVEVDPKTGRIKVTTRDAGGETAAAAWEAETKKLSAAP